MNVILRGCIVACCIWCLLAPPPVSGAVFGDFTVKDERELGRKFEVLIRSRMPIIEDPVIKGYVQDIVSRIRGAMEQQPFPVQSDVLLNSQVNAFAVPGGSVFVNTGLILAMEHEAELAGVLAHELAHVSERHIAAQIERAQTANLLSLAGMLAGMFLGGSPDASRAAMAGGAGLGQAMMLEYSRQHEDEADQVGMSYLVGAGYPPWGLAQAFDKIRRSAMRISTGGLPSYLSTHPAVNERIASMTQRIQRLPDSKKTPLPGQTDESRLQRVQTLIRARYTDPAIALEHFRSKGKLQCLDAMGMAVTLSRLNRIKDARAGFDVALACSNEDPLVLREAGRFFFEHGDGTTAGRLLQKAVMLNSKDLMALFFYARLLSEEGETETAARYFQRMLAELPEDAEIHYYYGRALGQGGQYFKAHLHLAYSALYSREMKQYRFHLEKARSLARGDAEAAEKLTALEATHDERSEFYQ